MNAAAYHEVKLIQRRWLSPTTFEIELSRPTDFVFKPGQRVAIKKGTLDKDYSICCAPDETTLRFCIRHIPDGALSPLLATANVGTRLKISQAQGYFLYRPSPQPVVFVATGTGIAPFVAMAQAGTEGFELLHGATTASELYYRDILQARANRYTACLSQPATDDAAMHNMFKGRVTAYLEQHFIKGAYVFYLSGRREMIRDVTLLVDEFFAGSLVYTEIFY